MDAVDRHRDGVKKIYKVLFMKAIKNI